MVGWETSPPLIPAEAYPAYATFRELSQGSWIYVPPGIYSRNGSFGLLACCHLLVCCHRQLQSKLPISTPSQFTLLPVYWDFNTGAADDFVLIVLLA